jgi:hypothetical protein
LILPIYCIIYLFGSICVCRSVDERAKVGVSMVVIA